MALHFPANWLCMLCVTREVTRFCPHTCTVPLKPLQPPLYPGSLHIVAVRSKPHPQVPGSACVMRYTGWKIGGTNFRLSGEALCIFMSLSPTFKNSLFPSAVSFNRQSWIKHREAANNKMVRQKEQIWIFFFTSLLAQWNSKEHQ